VVVKFLQMGVFETWVMLTSKFARVRVGCGCVSRSLVDDVSRKFPKFVFGSFFESFGVSPSGELLGLGIWGWTRWKVCTLFFSAKRGATLCCSVSLIRAKILCNTTLALSLIPFRVKNEL
jgi:hypothetical protein